MGRQASLCRPISLGRGPLARGAQLPQPRRRCRAEDSQLAQQPVAGRGLGSGGAEHARPRCRATPGRRRWDAVEHAALGGQDDRGPAQRVSAGGFRHGRASRRRARSRANPAGRGVRPWPGPAGGRIRQRPAMPGTGAGRRRRPLDQRRISAQASRRRAPRPAPASAGQLPPGRPGALGAAGQPPLLPAAAVLAGSQSSSAPPARRSLACRPPARQVDHLLRAGLAAGQSAAGGRGGNRVRAAR